MFEEPWEARVPTMTEPASHSGSAEPSDHDLLVAVEATQRATNLADAARLGHMLELFERRAADYKARKAEEPHFTLSPLEETAIEVAPLTGATEGRVKQEVRAAAALRARFPEIWALVCSGQLDMYRARIVSDAAEAHLPDPAAVSKFSQEMAEWFRRHLAEVERARAEAGVGADLPIVARTSRQIGNRVSYLVKKLRPRDADERFRRGFERRGVHTRSDGDGLGHMSLSHDVVSLKLVDYRLLLIAREMRRDGDPRTIEQLRSDLAVDLLLGRLTVAASVGELEDTETSSTGDPLDTVRQWPSQRWARPVINVTVPIQTLMGVTDTPGVLSGGESIPAGLVRMLAQDPESTWYRMLTDPARECVELSTRSYKATGSIWRQVVAAAGSCFGPVCVVPATESETDHRVPHPRGATSTENLGPGCKRHHKAKHAPHFGLMRRPDGRLVFTTGGGFAHPVGAAEQPVEDGWGREGLWEVQLDPAEIRDAVMYLRHERSAVLECRMLQREAEQEKADYRASYPDATEEEIHRWVHDDDPQASAPPPVLRRGDTVAAVVAREEAGRGPARPWGPGAYGEIA
jgi:hypothetical protein